MRDSLNHPRQQLKHWASMYKYASVVMQLVTAGSTLSAIRAYQLTKEPLWLIGGGVMFSVIPFTYIVLGGLIKNLQQEER